MERGLEKARKDAVAEVQARDTGGQIRFMADALRKGHLSPGKLKVTLENNARREMAKGGKKFVSEGKILTVDLLLAEFREATGLRELAASVGLDEEWFVALAEAECRKVI